MAPTHVAVPVACHLHIVVYEDVFGARIEPEIKYWLDAMKIEHLKLFNKARPLVMTKRKNELNSQRDAAVPGRRVRRNDRQEARTRAAHRQVNNLMQRSRFQIAAGTDQSVLNIFGSPLDEASYKCIDSAGHEPQKICVIEDAYAIDGRATLSHILLSNSASLQMRRLLTQRY